MGRRSADDNRARLAARAAGEPDDLVLANHHLLYQLAVPALDHLGVVERRHDFGAEHRSESVERGVLKAAHSGDRYKGRRGMSEYLVVMVWRRLLAEKQSSRLLCSGWSVCRSEA